MYIGQSEFMVNVSLTPLEQTIYLGENATFFCEAEITGTEEIGFRVVNGTEILQLISQNGTENCEYIEDELICMTAFDDNLMMSTSCQYDDPYSITCDLWVQVGMVPIEPLEVECFIVADGFIIITSESAILSVRCKFIIRIQY